MNGIRIRNKSQNEHSRDFIQLSQNFVGNASGQADGEIVTIEVPDMIKKQFAKFEDFQRWHEDFLLRFPPASTFKSKDKGNQDKKPVLKPKTKKRPAPKDLSKQIGSATELPEKDDILQQVPVVNCRASGKLETMPSLIVSQKVGIYIRNDCGQEVT